MSAAPHFMLLHCYSDHLSSGFLQKVSAVLRPSLVFARLLVLRLKLSMSDAAIVPDSSPPVAAVCLTIRLYVLCLCASKGVLVMAQMIEGWQSVFMRKLFEK